MNTHLSYRNGAQVLNVTIEELELAGSCFTVHAVSNEGDLTVERLELYDATTEIWTPVGLDTAPEGLLEAVQVAYDNECEAAYERRYAPR